MAKLIVLALAFAAIVAFASAHRTIVTTTNQDVEPASRQQCSQQILEARLDQCQRYLEQGQSFQLPIPMPWPFSSSGRQVDVQSCCQDLLQVDEQCQCEVLKEAFWQALQEEQSLLGKIFGSSQVKQMTDKAQNLPTLCRLRTRQCRMGPVSVTTTTVVSQGWQQCQNIRGRQFNQCQNYIQQQTGSGSPRMMSQGGIDKCCNELENVERECQCEAMQEVYRQAQGSQQGGSRPQAQDLQQVFQNLRNQCNLQVEQCRIPSAMF